MSQQQTVLRVQVDNVNIITGITEYENLDLYSDVPIKINKSIAEIQDISKRNSDYSIGLSLPGSKKNNRFFESYVNVDSQSLFFDANNSVQCQVILNGQSYFKGFLRLNKVSVKDSKVEYDVTLYSVIGDLYGKIGNNLLIDLDYDDTQYTFNHFFNRSRVIERWSSSNFTRESEYPYPYFYPIGGEHRRNVFFYKRSEPERWITYNVFDNVFFNNAIGSEVCPPPTETAVRNDVMSATTHTNHFFPIGVGFHSTP